MAVKRIELFENLVPRPLDIGLVTETYPPEINGVALTLARLVRQLVVQGHRITVVRPQRPDDTAPHPENVEIVRVPGAPLPAYPELRFGLPVLRRLRQLWRRRRPDVLYIATEGPLGWAAARAARELGIPAVSGFHTRFDKFADHYHLSFAGGWIERYLRRFHNNTLATVVPTADLKAVLERRGYDNVVVAPRAVDTERFNPTRRDGSLRAEWGVVAGHPVVVWVGRLAPEKNLELTIKAFEAFQHECPEAKMVWVGDGPARESLQRRHPNHVFAGMRHGEDLARHYASADVFFFASETETFGNVVLEALASGLAVVAYDYGAAREHIIAGTDGYLAPLGDERQFIGWARHLGRHPDARRRLRHNAPSCVVGLKPAMVAARFAEMLAGFCQGADQ